MTIKLNTNKETPARKFVRAMYDRHMVNPLNDREFIMSHEQGHAFFDMSPSGHDEAHIHYFRTHPRKSGVGSHAIKELQKHAAEHGVKLHGTIGGHETPHKVLKKFYAKHGFKVKNGEDIHWDPKDHHLNESILTEEHRFLSKVHPHVSPEALKNIAKHSQFGTARFAIDRDGKTWGADAAKFLHAHLGPHEPENGYMNLNNHHTAGFVSHNPKSGKFTYFAVHAHDLSDSTHPHLEKFHKAGIMKDHSPSEVRNIKEDGGAPTVSAGAGLIAGMGVGPQGEPGRRSILMPLARRRLDVLNRVKKASKERTQKKTDMGWPDLD